MRAGPFYRNPAYVVAQPTSSLKAAFRVEPPPAGCAPVGAPLLFMPAMSLTMAEWRFVGDKVQACRARVYMDAPAVGESPETAHMTEDAVLKAVIDVIDANGGRAVLVGSSLGSIFAVRLAARVPDKVEALVIAAMAAEPFSLNRWETLVLHPALWTPGFRLAGPYLNTKLSLPRLIGPRGDPETVAMIAGELVDSGKRDTLMRYYRWFAAPDALKVTRGDLRQVTRPVLIIWGDNDRVVKPYMAMDIKAALTGTYVKVRIMQAGHLTPIEQPDQVAREIDAFLRDLEPQPFVAQDTPRVELKRRIRQGDRLYGAIDEWFPLLGLGMLWPLAADQQGRFDVGPLVGVAYGSIDRHYPLEAGRVVALVGASAFTDPINPQSWSFGYLRGTLRLELVWRWVGGIHLDGTLLVDPVPDRVGRVGGYGALGYTSSVVPWLRGFVGYGVLPGGASQGLVGFEIDTRLTGLMY